MSQSPYPEVSPDPFERFPAYPASAEPDPEPTGYLLDSIPASQGSTDPYHQAPAAHLPAPLSQQASLVTPAAPPAYVGGQQLQYPLTDQQPVSTTMLVVTWVVAVVTGFYMLPWAIAVTRGKSNQWAIFAGNLLLGWTVVGWIVALVKACGAHQLAYPVAHYVAITTGQPAPAGQQYTGQPAPGAAPRYPGPQQPTGSSYGAAGPYGPQPAHPSAPATLQPGWYPLADGSGTRYWNGTSWTATVQH